MGVISREHLPQLERGHLALGAHLRDELAIPAPGGELDEAEVRLGLLEGGAPLGDHAREGARVPRRALVAAPLVDVGLALVPREAGER